MPFVNPSSNTSYTTPFIPGALIPNTWFNYVDQAFPRLLDINGNNIVTGNNTYSGTSAFTGPVSFSGSQTQFEGPTYLGVFGSATSVLGPLTVGSGGSIKGTGTAYIDMSAATGIFTTPSGAVTLGPGAVNITGYLQILGAATASGLLQANGGLSVNAGNAGSFYGPAGFAGPTVDFAPATGTQSVTFGSATTATFDGPTVQNNTSTLNGAVTVSSTGSFTSQTTINANNGVTTNYINASSNILSLGSSGTTSVSIAAPSVPTQINSTLGVTGALTCNTLQVNAGSSFASGFTVAMNSDLSLNGTTTVGGTIKYIQAVGTPVSGTIAGWTTGKVIISGTPTTVFFPYYI